MRASGVGTTVALRLAEVSGRPAGLDGVYSQVLKSPPRFSPETFCARAMNCAVLTLPPGVQRGPALEQVEEVHVADPVSQGVECHLAPRS